MKAQTHQQRGGWPGPQPTLDLVGAQLVKPILGVGAAQVPPPGRLRRALPSPLLPLLAHLPAAICHRDTYLFPLPGTFLSSFSI